MENMYFLMYLLMVVSANPLESDTLTVKIKQGSVRGYKEEGKNYYAFYGVPYATAPTGPDKFKAPLPPKFWTNILEATNREIICPQSDMLLDFLPHLRNRTLVMDENCLNVNVFTPGKDESLPVYVHIHGGSFQIGFGNMNSYEQLLRTGKIVEVNFNYRLGIPGFLCLGTEDVPGNAGMKDQLAALRWVKENIAQFGGNPDDITLGGFSAGSASVDLHFLSDASNGLFNRIIPESGNAIGAWAVQIDPLSNALGFAKKHNFVDTGNVYDLENFYKRASSDVLFLEHFFFEKDSQFTFVPCLERIKENSFLTEVPLDILKNRKYEKMPALYGVSNMEGLFRIFKFKNWKDGMNEKFSDFLPVNLQFADDAQKEKVAGVIKKFYFGEEKVGTNTVQAYVDYFTDVLFAYPMLKTVALLSEAENDVYEYEYSFVDKTPHPLDPYKLGGAYHCAQSDALSYNLFTKDTGEQTNELEEMRRILTELWLNFVTTSKPVPENSKMFPESWPAVTSNKNAYMQLNLLPELKTDMILERFKLWDCIYGKYYRAPIPPPVPQ